MTEQIVTEATRPARPHTKLTLNAKGDTQVEVGLDAQDSGMSLEEVNAQIEAEYDRLILKYKA